MREWTVTHDPHDGWYQFRIYEGDTLVANIPQRQETGRIIAEQIARDHNALAASQARIERLTALVRRAESIIADEWTGPDGEVHSGMDGWLREARAALDGVPAESGTSAQRS